MPSQFYNDMLLGLAHPPGVQPLIKGVGGGVDVTLSAAEYASGYFTFTGVITANINVILPASGCYLIPVFNSTTGAFTLTVKGTTGTGIVVAIAKRAILLFDGVNMIRLTADI